MSQQILQQESVPQESVSPPIKPTPLKQKEEADKTRKEAEKERRTRRRGPKKMPSIISEKLEEYDDERIMIIHFSPKILKKAPNWRRANRAAKYVREFIAKYVKYVNHASEDGSTKKLRIAEPKIWISPQINEIIWKNGARNPPKRIRVRVLIKIEEINRDEEDRPISCNAEIRVFPYFQQ